MRNTEVKARPTWVVRLLLLAIVAGQLQNLVDHLLDYRAPVTFIDDSLILLALVASTPRLVRQPSAPAYLTVVWIMIMVSALLVSIYGNQLPTGPSFGLFRQVTMPALILLIGVVLRREEWRIIGTATIFFSLANAAYVAFETFAFRPIDLVAVAAASGDYLGTYSGYDPFTGDRIERAGGYILNPPSLGCLIGAGLAIAWHRGHTGRLLLIQLALSMSLYATGSRGGFLIAIVGVLFPWIARSVSPAVAGALFVITAVPFGSYIAGHSSGGGDERHVNGLLAGISDALTHPLGRGFGYVGNHRPEGLTHGDRGETLLGIAFSAGGMPALALALLVTTTLLFRLNSRSHGWVAALALGGFLAALFAETAGAINATVPIWLAVGLALRRFGSPPHRHARPGAAVTVAERQATHPNAP